jgi:hypothetical protein
MKKGTVIAFLILVPMIGVSATTPGKQKPTKSSSNRPISIAALTAQPTSQSSVAIKKDDTQDPHRVVMILQTRYYMLTIYGGEDHLYSVSTQDGVALAEKLSPGELKMRFPELHDLVNEGWACDSPMHF